MNKADIKRLKASIAHHKRLLSGKRIMLVNYNTGEKELETISGEFCALCDRYFERAYVTCVGCPVCYKTGKVLCQGTPYHDAADAWNDHGPDSDEFKEAEAKEVAFLESLLPHKEG